MARLVDCYPSSEDELPRLNVLLGRTSARKLAPMPRATPKPPPNNGLVPRTAATPSTRRVRRFRDQLTDANPLFLPWSGSQESDLAHDIRGASQVPPHSSLQGNRQMPGAVLSGGLSYAMLEDSPPPTARASRTRRRLVARLLDSDGEGGSTCDTRDNSTLLNKASRAQYGINLTNRSSRRSTPVAELVDSGNAASVTFDPASTESLSPYAQKADPDSVANDEEPSIYETAVEDSHSESESSDSDFELSDSSEDVFASPLAQGLPPIARTRRVRQAKTQENGPRSVLNARSPNMRNLKSIAAGPPSVKGKMSSPDIQAEVRQPRAASIRRSTASHESVLTRDLDALRTDFSGFSDNDEEAHSDSDDAHVPRPRTPCREVQSKGLVSPRKRDAIPKTPHRPSVDAFWNKELVDGWNEQHSPQKAPNLRLAPSPAKERREKAAEKKSFDARKVALAEDFLRQLNEKIADGKISELAKPTGGVKLIWTKTLNTTAGRANWKRETIRTKQTDGTIIAVNHMHHASIELAEKVIDDDHKLLNVLAHEFCHLANFMITGITNNPHGKEFKTWAAKCSRAFGESHGIQVTTKHTYDIDFKYTWQCSTCGSEYKRHSRSIDPQRHKCGGCKGTLIQTKPCPRKTNAGSGQGGKPTEYQTFVKEQMRIVKAENPSRPQKDVMRIVANKWAKTRGKKSMATDNAVEPSEVDLVTAQMVDLTVDNEGKDRT
ncbi:hypothetical protein JDV02_003648 [Purpureocillium takamizusanense]|uniref:SprT-like domain-containing protein n=1 Tax=Purpureocillium takamizusanense TaxID=2060973 RepID=A0A9Q8QD91_9HYPO|nr:uncharacterized protein JDV02_003648 [Purpureocillium takamizusanense]UNI17293.1 hypothetical protein JDV02_003648 [Purpureocillium takamizusanense]